MKTLARYAPATLVNVIVFFVLQVIAQLVYFLLSTKTGFEANTTKWVPLCFVLVQIATLFFLYKKKYLVLERLLLIINVLFLIGLYIVFIQNHLLEKLS